MWANLDWQAWLTLGVVFVMMVALIREIARPDLIFLGSLGLLLVFGILTPEDAFQGLSNTAVLAVGALFVVAAGVQNTGALSFIDRLLFAKSASLTGVLARVMVTTAALSAFLNNTPIVAMLIPRIQAWSEESGVPVSKVLIPLSYAAIVGGMTTLIGTSTNLLISGLMEASGYEGLDLFDLSWVGVPAALGAILYLTFIGHRFLPDRSKREGEIESGLESYQFEIRLTADSPLVGQTVEDAGLRHLGDAYLIHIDRQDELVPSSPHIVLRADDVLGFVGNISALDKLLERPGFERAVTGLQDDRTRKLPLFEAVVAPSSRLINRTLREANFRQQFRGVVLGIQRRDMFLEGPLGNVPIKAGDLLLIEARPEFAKRWSGRRSEFYLVAPRRPEVVGPQTKKAPIALLILVGVVVLAALGIAPIVTTAFAGALAMIVTRCIRGWEARQSVDFSVLIVIAAALGIGKAIESTGLADAIATTIISTASPFGPVGVLVAIYFATSILTEFVTNNAAAALMLTIGLATAQDLSLPPETFAIAIAIAASASFLTPIGYQTNLMVMAAGGYRFADYTRTGIFVNLIVASIAITMIAVFWM